MGTDREACGRCSMSVVVDATSADAETDHDPYGEARIEVDDDRLRTLSPGAWISRLTARIDDAASRFVWGR
ncbi:hypothetical protein A6E15_04155 [Natrinema saccharevitans]|uniref:Uncharacterized protein n=1 Tax=Natrinema saccharevitans TaxID=301967 RepID=A0A1S8AV04_9EURY|nr:hypothetical protein [Natrinema saccharevitans]OLZ40224.1 hypothetical protein A6E15_04155 [Natrinema saccharevitans]